jgi:hypothetical protein
MALFSTILGMRFPLLLFSFQNHVQTAWYLHSLRELSNRKTICLHPIGEKLFYFTAETQRPQSL